MQPLGRDLIPVTECFIPESMRCIETAATRRKRKSLQTATMRGSARDHRPVDGSIFAALFIFIFITFLLSTTTSTTFIMDKLPDSLQKKYAALERMRGMMETMKQNQSIRGVEGWKQRMAHRAATHNTWRQMKGMQLVMHEINHPGLKPFAIGFGYVRQFRGKRLKM